MELIKEELDKNLPKYIGFEVELAGIKPSKAASILGFEYNESIDWPKWVGESGFQIVEDNSIKTVKTILCKECNKVHLAWDRRNGFELVSPKTHISKVREVISQFEEYMKLLVPKGAVANVTTGVHVHVDAELLSKTDLKDILMQYVSVEDAAYKLFTGDIDIPRVMYIHLYNFAKSMEQFVEVVENTGEVAFDSMINKYWGWYVSKKSHEGDARNTVEYRLFNSTTNSVKLAEMIFFALGCSYLGKLGITSTKPEYFNPKTKINMDSVEKVRGMVELGRDLVEMYE